MASTARSARPELRQRRGRARGTGKVRRREATRGEIQLLIVICRPTWAKVARSLRVYGGIDVDVDSGAQGPHRREELRRVHELPGNARQRRGGRPPGINDRGAVAAHEYVESRKAFGRVVMTP